MTALAVTVDDGTCIGARSCVFNAPDAFALGDDGTAIVRPSLSDVSEDVVMEAAQSCPNGAIAVVRDGVHLWP